MNSYEVTISLSDIDADSAEEAVREMIAYLEEYAEESAYSAMNHQTGVTEVIDLSIR